MDDNRQTERRREKDTRTILALSAERKMIDGHIREIEGDVFEYLPGNLPQVSPGRPLLLSAAATQRWHVERLAGKSAHRSWSPLSRTCKPWPCPRCLRF